LAGIIGLLMLQEEIIPFDFQRVISISKYFAAESLFLVSKDLRIKNKIFINLF
jgi:hypothetical protein